MESNTPSRNLRRESKRPRASILVNNNNNNNQPTPSTSKKPRTTISTQSRNSKKPTWRPSLLDGTYKSKSLGKDLNKRINLVKGPASAALEGLLEIGNGEDSEGELNEEDDNVYRLDNRRITEFDAFEGKLSFFEICLF